VSGVIAIVGAGFSAHLHLAALEMTRRANVELVIMPEMPKPTPEMPAFEIVPRFDESDSATTCSADLYQRIREQKPSARNSRFQHGWLKDS
jgi:hypothetical protein